LPYVVGPQVASEFPPQAGACGTHRLASSTHRRTDGICRKNHLPLGHAIRARNCAPPAPVDSRRGAHENGGGCGWAAEQSWARSKAGFGFGALHLYDVGRHHSFSTRRGHTAMDRDTVNAIHTLYLRGATRASDILSLVWSADTEPELAALAQLKVGKYELHPTLIAFLKAVESQLATLPRPDYIFSFPLGDPPRQPGEKRAAFVAMPYKPKWSKAIETVIQISADQSNFLAKVSRNSEKPGLITSQIWNEIRRAEVVVAEISDENPNVFYELGFAHALGKEVILLSQNVLNRPFDISTARLLHYRVDDLPLLGKRLKHAFAQISPRYKFESAQQPYF